MKTIDVIETSCIKPRAYTVDAFGQVMSLGRTKIYEMINNGELRSKVIGGRRLIPAEETDRLLSDGEGI